MTSSNPPGARPAARRRAALLAACLAPLLAACGGAAAQVQLPVKAAATTSAQPAAAPLTPRQQVVVAFTGYTAAMTAAFDSRSPAQVRQLLRPVPRQGDDLERGPGLQPGLGTARDQLRPRRASHHRRARSGPARPGCTTATTPASPAWPTPGPARSCPARSAVPHDNLVTRLESRRRALARRRADHRGRPVRGVRRVAAALLLDREPCSPRPRCPARRGARRGGQRRRLVHRRPRRPVDHGAVPVRLWRRRQSGRRRQWRAAR